MTVMLLEDAIGEELWFFIDDNDTPPDPDDYCACREWIEERDGMLDIVGVDKRELTINEALTIADHYGGGEFDNEVAGIVEALCVIRDAYRQALSDVTA